MVIMQLHQAACFPPPHTHLVLKPMMSCPIAVGEPRVWDRKKYGAGIKMLGSRDQVSHHGMYLDFT